MFSLILFIFGLTFGSFLNVVSFRYSPEKSLFSFRNLLGRSHCPQCGKTLNWYELVPVFSFLIQKGKCRSCGEKISWQYPLVELASGFIFLLPLYFYSPLINGQWTMVFCGF
ncbi:MAG: prepilin peptidase [bacterium]|nr:prepilin peptidase [bacterium]